MPALNLPGDKLKASVLFTEFLSVLRGANRLRTDRGVGRAMSSDVRKKGGRPPRHGGRVCRGSFASCLQEEDRLDG
jgi:hypothetical protein